MNFSEQSFVRKVAVANFATIAERLLCRDGCDHIRRIHIPQPKSGLTLYDSTRKVEQLTHNPNGVCLKFAAGCAKHCEQIGVRVLTQALHRHRCLCSGETLVDAIDTHLYHTR